MKKLSALLLCCLLVFTVLPSAALAENSGTAEPLSGDYIEGEAIVCMETSAAGMLRRSAVPELLANAEVLMTVVCAAPPPGARCWPWLKGKAEPRLS